jgi:hypothetical protein
MYKISSVIFHCSKDGSVQDVEVAGTPSKSRSDEIGLQISARSIAPSHAGSVAVQGRERIELNILCPPRFPGLVKRLPQMKPDRRRRERYEDAWRTSAISKPCSWLCSFSAGNSQQDVHAE